jgi:hypothetical protein
MVSVASVNGFSASLSLACSRLPSWWGCGFAPSTLSGSAAEYKDDGERNQQQPVDARAFRITPGPGLAASSALVWAGWQITTGAMDIAFRHRPYPGRLRNVI